MNSYDLSRSFWNWAFENPDKIKPIHSALYFFAIEHCNRLGWKVKFGLPTTMAKEAIGIKSYNTYIKALNDLCEFGFIILIEKSKNQYSSNIIALSNFDKAGTKALDKALIKHGTKQSESTVQSIGSIYKQETIEQETKNKGTIAFLVFWNLYDKKVDKVSSERKWHRLSLDDHKAIIDYIPAYKKSEPDKKFRKNPLTFLNNRSWENELIHASSDDGYKKYTYDELLSLKQYQGRYKDFFKVIEKDVNGRVIFAHVDDIKKHNLPTL